MSGNTAESGFTPRRLVIVGCRGRMGTLLSARWSAAGHTVAGLDLPLTDVVLHVMDWMNDNGYIDEDQAAMVRYYEEKMGVTVGEKS